MAKSICDKISGYTDSWIIDFPEENPKYEMEENLIHQVESIIDNIQNKKKELFDLFKESEKISRNSKKLEDKIWQTLESDIIIKINREINEQNKILGAQERGLELHEKEVSKKQKELQLLKNRERQQHDRLIKNKKKKDCYEKISTVVNTLSRFEKELTKKKLTQLEENIYNCYSRIHRKTGFVKNVKINPSSFEVTMLDKNAMSIPIDKLSAGEKQIYAISVLWALSKTSGKALPMIIDTPLGRLDINHREKLVNNFFSQAGHQVIILSTDTEIDEVYFSDMEKHITHSYSLDFNMKSGHSNIHDGYLFNKYMSDMQ